MKALPGAPKVARLQCLYRAPALFGSGEAQMGMSDIGYAEALAGSNRPEFPFVFLRTFV